MISILGNANTCRQVSNHSSLRDVTWKTQNCLITFDTIGIWPETVDGIDLTAGCKNATNTLLASGDDFGKVKLYSYPVAWPKVSLQVNTSKFRSLKDSYFQASSSTYGGHSCPVSSVVFTHEDKFLISTGGKDAAILQWKLT